MEYIIHVGNLIEKDEEESPFNMNLVKSSDPGDLLCFAVSVCAFICEGQRSILGVFINPSYFTMFVIGSLTELRAL